MNSHVITKSFNFSGNFLTRDGLNNTGNLAVSCSDADSVGSKSTGSVVFSSCPTILSLYFFTWLLFRFRWTPSGDSITTVARFGKNCTGFRCKWCRQLVLSFLLYQHFVRFFSVSPLIRIHFCFSFKISLSVSLLACHHFLPQFR